jgi:hypothetical protein
MFTTRSSEHLSAFLREKKLGWKVWNDAEAQWNMKKFPKDYAIF